MESHSISFQPFETLSPNQPSSYEARARGRWERSDKERPVALWQAERFLFFAPIDTTEKAEWNFILTALGNPIFNPPAKAIEKLGETRTLELFFRRAIANGSFGRLFVLQEKGTRWVIILNSNGRHLLTNWDQIERRENRDWTPFRWEAMDGVLESEPSSLLFEKVQHAWNDSNSSLVRAKHWHGLDYFARLWHSLSFQNGNADLLREIIVDSVQISQSLWSHPHELVHSWTFGFSLWNKNPEIRLTSELFQKRGDAYRKIPDEKLQLLHELFDWLHPARTRSSQQVDLGQQEWLDHSGGTSSWNFEISIPRISGHEQIEASLRLERNLAFWAREKTEYWLDIWSQ
jgi:hypothetical protein